MWDGQGTTRRDAIVPIATRSGQDPASSTGKVNILHQLVIDREEREL